MTLKNSEQETELNWLVRLKRTAVRVGERCACWSPLMNFLFANSERKRELNWLVRLKKTAVWVGEQCACWGALMNFLFVSCIALTTNDVLLGMLRA